MQIRRRGKKKVVEDIKALVRDIISKKNTQTEIPSDYEQGPKQPKEDDKEKDEKNEKDKENPISKKDNGDVEKEE